MATGTCNGVELFQVNVPVLPAFGFAGVGTDIYGYADFDNIRLSHSAGPSMYSNSKTLYFLKERS